MAFLPNIPQPTDQLSISQGNILNNFTILGAIAGNTNASSASINNTSGFNWLYLPPQGATPPAGAAFTAGNIGLYSATNSVTSINELYINKTNQVTVVQVPATASVLSTTSAPGNNSSGWSYLPSGVILKWGKFATVPGSNTVSFPVAATIPVFTECFQVIISTTGIAAADVFVTLNSFTATTMTVYSTNRTSTSTAVSSFTYLAIGR